MSVTLKRTLGLPALCFYGVGMIIGAGVYSVIGSAAGLAGPGLWLSFVIGSVAAFLTGLSYAELATMFPEAGAEYVYVRESMPRRRAPPFLIGFVLAVAAAATASTVALAFGGYLTTFAPLPAWLSAVVLLILATALNIGGIRESTWVNVVFTTLEVVGLLLVIWVAMRSARFDEGVGMGTFTGVTSGAALIFFVYLGFEEIANLAEESRQPATQIPRAILISLAVSTVLYVLVALSVVALLSPEKLASSDSPLADAVATISPRTGRILAGIALFSTANTALITLIAGSRMVFGMGRSGDMPRLFGRILSRRETPWVGALAVLTVSLLLLPVGGVAEVASLSSFASLLAFTSVNLVLIVLRYRKPDHRRPFRVPLTMAGFPVLPALGIVVVLILLVRFDRVAYLGGGVVLLLAIIAYMLDARFRARRVRSA